MIEYISYNEVYYAYKECAQTKKYTGNAANFEINENRNIYKLYIFLNSGKYKIGKSIVFIEYFPKPREIFAADFIDRVVQHIIVRRLNSYFEKEFIPNSFSCRKYKGTLKGIKVLQNEIEELSGKAGRPVYILIGDCKSYFYSLDKRILLNKIIKLIDKYHIFKDFEKDFFINIIRQIVFNCPQDNCIRKGSNDDFNLIYEIKKTLFLCDKFHGLPIGNISSQVFSNVYMNDFDHWITEEFKNYGRYGRYCDDFYILSLNKEKLFEYIPKIREYLKEINITLHPNKLYIQEVTKKGCKFIGGIIKKDRTYISNRTVGRCYDLIIKAYYYIQENEFTFEDCKYLVRSLNSYFGFFSHHKTFNIRKKIINSKYMKPFIGKYIEHEEYKKFKIIKGAF